MIRPTEINEGLQKVISEGNMPFASVACKPLIDYILHLESQRMTREDAGNNLRALFRLRDAYLNTCDPEDAKAFENQWESLITLLTGSAGSEKPQPEKEGEG